MNGVSHSLSLQLENISPYFSSLIRQLQFSINFLFSSSSKLFFSNWPYILDFVLCVFLDLVTSYFKLSYWGLGWVLHPDHSYGFDYQQYVYSVLNSDLNLYNSFPWCPLECNSPDPWLCQPSHVWTPKPQPHPTPTQFLITWNGFIIYPTDQVEFIDWDCISHNHLAFPYIAIGFGGGKNFDHCKTTNNKNGMKLERWIPFHPHSYGITWESLLL